MLERSALGVSIGVSRGDIEPVKDLRLVQQAGGKLLGQFSQHACDDVPPCLLAAAQVQRLDRLLGRLVRGEAGPFVAAVFQGPLGLVQVSLGLGEPVACAVGHVILSLHSSGVTSRDQQRLKATVAPK